MGNVYPIGSFGYEKRIEMISRMDLSQFVIAVDFDGTCVRHEFPEIGDDVPGAVDVLIALYTAGAKLILWTMRHDGVTDHKELHYLNHAVDWFNKHQIQLFGVNENCDQAGWSASPKCYAQIYIDDAALGCPLTETEYRPYVDWAEVARLLIKRFHFTVEQIHRAQMEVVCEQS